MTGRFKKMEVKKDKPVVASYCPTFLKSDMQHVYRQITGLQEFESVVLTQRRENEDAFPFKKKKIAMHEKPKTRFFRRLWCKQIRGRPVRIYEGEVRPLLHALLRLEADLLHIYFGHIGIYLLPLIEACPRPVIVSFHGADASAEMERPAAATALREVFRRSTLILARSESLRRRLAELGCPEEKIRLSRTGIPLEQIPMVERELPGEEGGWRFLQACRFIEKKGLLTTLEAFAEIRKSNPDARLCLAGDGPLAEKLKAQAQSLGIGDQVEFPGFLNQETLRKRTAAAHFFFHPSVTGADGDREGVPNAMLEAMASGLPILATRHGGIPEAVPEEAGSVLVEEGDAQALAAGALELMANASGYREAARAARRSVEENFERGAVIAKLESFYREAMELGGQR